MWFGKSCDIGKLDVYGSWENVGSLDTTVFLFNQGVSVSSGPWNENEVGVIWSGDKLNEVFPVHD